VRLKVNPVSGVSLLLAVFNGDPAGPGPGDEQLRNRYGLNFRVTDPALVIGEAQFRRNGGKTDEGLATTLKLGGWGHFGQFDDQRFAVGGALLADPAGSGVPIRRRGNSGIYAIIDQQLYRPKGVMRRAGSRSSAACRPVPPTAIWSMPISTAALSSPAWSNRPDDVWRQHDVRQVFGQRLRFRSRHDRVHRVPGVSATEMKLEPTLHGADRAGLTVQPDCNSSGIRTAMQPQCDRGGRAALALLTFRGAAANLRLKNFYPL
jgi:porin